MASMSCKITVIARVGEAGTWLARLVNSLDAQDLPYDEFEAVFLVPDVGSGVGQRLAGLSGRRPNVRVAAMAPAAAGLAQEISGEWVLDLGPGLSASQPVLFPQALSRLVGFAAQHGCQAVLGRAVTRTGNVVEDIFVTDRPRLDGGEIPLGGPGQAVVLRRDLAMAPGPGAAADPARSLAGVGHVGVLAAYPSLLITPPRHAAAGGSVRVEKSAVQWRRGRLVVTVTGSAQDTSAGEMLFGIRHKGSGLEYWLPGSTTTCAGGVLAGTAEIDVRTAALGSPLGEGVWTVAVGVHQAGTRRYVFAPVTPAPGPPAGGVVDGVLVAPTAVGAQFALDVGATRSRIVPRLSPADVDIAESARGTLLTARLDGLAVDGDSRTPGSLHLGRFPLPACLVAQDGRARIECFVSGLAGTSALSAQFGRGKPEAVGLDLVISPTGVMTVVPAPDPPAGGPATAPGGAPPPARAAGASAVVRLRRGVPAPIEPAVRLLARNKVAARVYRALTTGRAARR
jgi:hypothetical protein